MAYFEVLLTRERFIIISGLILLTLLAWVYTLAGIGMDMSAVEMTRDASIHADMASTTRWTTFNTLLMLAMWWIMMIAMMLPSAAPTILLAAALNRRSRSAQPPYGSVSFFTAGYLLAWLFFSVVAVILQWALQHSGLLSMLMHSSNAYVISLILISAGLWQLTPIKRACLRYCRSPVVFLTRHRRPGNRGALLMGIEHGIYCLGCCWFLMALLFVGGVMNIYWIAGLALYVLAEKLLPFGQHIATVSGIALLIIGLWFLF